MSDSLIKVSVQLPHPNVYVQMWWQEAKHQSVRGTGALPAPDMVSGLAIPTGTPVVSVAAKLVTLAAPAVTSPGRGSQGWGGGEEGSSSDEGDDYHGTGSCSQRFPAPSVSLTPHPPPPPMFGCRRPLPSAYHQRYSRLLLRIPTARSLVSARLIARFVSVLMMHVLAFARTTMIGLMGGALICHARQADTLLSFLISFLIRNQLPSS